MNRIRLVTILQPLLYVLIWIGLGTFPVVAQDWPQWRGPQRSGLSVETGLLKSWPAEGPPRSWSISGLGEGYGSLAIKGDRILLQGTTGGASVVFCLSRQNGRTIWSAALGPKVSESRGNGPRGTPTIDDDRVYVLTENGDLACLRLRDGSSIWRKNILREFAASNPNWMISESPLIDGERVIVSPGGRNAGMVAFNKMTGSRIWVTQDLSDEAAYSSPIIVDVGGIRTILNFTANAAVGIRASDGKLMFSYDRAANGTANCATPVYAENKVFFSSAYG
ncbi:MAG: PQQ-binding-like beta-propeller repeat protein, partial [Acidobacteriota bacterium]